MSFPNVSKIAAAAAGLTMAGLVSFATPASADFRPYGMHGGYGDAHLIQAQYYGRPYHHDGFYGRPFYRARPIYRPYPVWGPRCVVRSRAPSPWGREVVSRRICR